MFLHKKVYRKVSTKKKYTKIDTDEFSSEEEFEIVPEVSETEISDVDGSADDEDARICCARKFKTN